VAVLAEVGYSPLALFVNCFLQQRRRFLHARTKRTHKTHARTHARIVSSNHGNRNDQIRCEEKGQWRERERERERKRKRENKRDDGEEGKTRTNKKRAKKLEQNRTCDLWETKDTLFGQSAETFFHACPELLDTVINK
jgi:hypothetical protein